MKTRLISGTCYVAILIAFYLLKIFVHDLCFDVLIYAFALIGTFEMLRAVQDKTTKAERGIVFAFAVVSIPLCAVAEHYFSYGLHWVTICFFVMAVALVCLLVIRHEETSLESLGLSFLSAVYPVLLLCLLVQANHVPKLPAFSSIAFNSDLLILFIFVVSPFADTFAYLFGRCLKKYFPRKFAPVISPNKTVVGAIGGLVGGLIGAAILYFAYNAVVGSFENMGFWLTVYLLIGLFAAAATEFGDLVESCIKRKLGLKDMGKIMPGHGGVLDRIDGTLFAAMVVYLAFAAVRMLLAP
ncbi:MAG: phosphatidate cytidylyltransferase [Clostridia bacterium]|nr:phosphatidate cytidylyltransferase [Clostridia bacterium]